MSVRETDEDALLMARFVATRDRRVFEMLFERYKRPMVAHAMRFVRNQARAEELAQDVFVRVYTTKRYSPDARFKTWLYQVSTNLCLNALRSAKKRKGDLSLDEEGAVADPVAPGGSAPDAVAAGRQLADRLNRALSRLPAKQRAALLMAREEDMSHAEIAESLSTSVPAVKSLIHRALETLRQEVDAHREDRPPARTKEAIS